MAGRPTKREKAIVCNRSWRDRDKGKGREQFFNIGRARRSFGVSSCGTASSKPGPVTTATAPAAWQLYAPDLKHEKVLLNHTEMDKGGTRVCTKAGELAVTEGARSLLQEHS